MAPTREYTHLTNRVTSQCELVTFFFRHSKLADTFSLTPWVWETLISIQQKFRQDWGLNPRPSDYKLCVLPLGLLHSSILVRCEKSNEGYLYYLYSKAPPGKCKLTDNWIIPRVEHVVTPLHFDFCHKNTSTDSTLFMQDRGWFLCQPLSMKYK